MSTLSINPVKRIGIAAATISLRLRNRLFGGELARHDRRTAVGKAKVRRISRRIKRAYNTDAGAPARAQVERLDRAGDAITATLAQLSVDSALIGERVFTVIESVRAALVIALEQQDRPLVPGATSEAMHAANDSAIDAVVSYESALVNNASDGEIDWETAEAELSELERQVAAAHRALAATMPRARG